MGNTLNWQLHLTVYRDENVPIVIRTADYFDPNHVTNTGNEITDENYYRVLQDR